MAEDQRNPAESVESGSQQPSTDSKLPYPTDEEEEEESPVIVVPSTTTATTRSVGDDCEPILETMDDFVACAEGVNKQSSYEDFMDHGGVGTMLRKEQEHGLSAEEAALVRLQIMEADTNEKDKSLTCPDIHNQCPDIGELALCGSDEDIDDAKRLSKIPESTDGNKTKPTAALQHLQCAICFDEADSPDKNDGKRPSSPSKKISFAYLPCCGSDGREASSTTKICTACILLLSNPTSDGSARIGRCPRCRSWISVSEKGESIQVLDKAGKCVVCNQIKEHLVDENDSVCDACFLGRRRPLLYECEQCHATQRIPHPMYRYQPALDQFGTTSWACHGRCSNFTMWRILPDQVQYIPAGDVPEAWGQDYMQVARDHVMEARRGIVQSAGNSGRKNGVGDQCVIQ